MAPNSLTIQREEHDKPKRKVASILGHQRTLTAIQGRAAEVIEGAFATLLLATIAFQFGLVAVRAL